MRTVSCLMPGCALLALGCTSQESSLPKEVITGVQTCVAREDPQACAALYTDDAQIIGAGFPVVTGRAAIVEFYKGQIAPDLAMYTDAQTNVVEGDLAVDEGSYRIQNLNTREFVEDGEYMNVLRRRGGEWKVFRSFFIPHHAPKTSASVSGEPLQSAGR
jgi:ketosteroid isomerase-like protein